MGPDMGAYPNDQLSQIKMRNRRFQQSCAMEGMQGGYAPQPAPMMRGPVYAPQPMMMLPQMTEDMMMMGGMQDELAMIDQDLNMTKRSNLRRRNLSPHLSLWRGGKLVSPIKSPSAHM